MPTQYLISVDEFCASHSIEISFIHSLQQTGMIDITRVEEKFFLNEAQLEQTERYVRFYYDLDINLEGIETIVHLLDRVNRMQNEIVRLRNRLLFYETE